MSKLPDIFQNKINKKIDNDLEVYASFNDKSNLDRSIKVEDIFKGKDFIYKRKVLIIYNSGETKEEYIVSKNNKYLITIDNKKININDIKEVRIK